MTIAQYIDKLHLAYTRGNATEHTYRGYLKELVESLVQGITATNEPKRQKCGAPDYILTRKDIPMGFIEAKDIGDNDLKGEKLKGGNKEQFDRYKGSLGNIIFTDYIDFYLYREGKLVAQVRIGEVTDKGIKALPDNFDTFTNLIKDFCTHIGQTITSSQKLAQMMAGKARLMADVIEKAILSDVESQENSSLQEQMLAFKEILIHDITPKGFADVYAQTIVYGMFAARLHDKTLDTFSRQEAYDLIPKSNPFLKKLFGYIAGLEVDDRIKWIVDSLVEVFLACNVQELLKDYGKSTQTEDAIIHFYETFLSEYDASLRKARGVWYTPAPVVNFIVRAVDDILKAEFGLPKGLADNSKTNIKIKLHESDKRYTKDAPFAEAEVHKVQILDPATGTGTFLAEVIKHIHQKFKGQQGIWNGYVEQDLLPRLNGFELLMASYAMAHLQLDLLLSETGYTPTTNQRLKVFLTNSLEEPQDAQFKLAMAQWLSDEGKEADKIKRETPVMCIIGNPPYSGESANKGEWIMKLMEDYKKEPDNKGKLQEKNPKWINDDYVKFLRYGQYFIEKNGSGVLAFINPHGFLDNPTFRGMRYNLLQTYDKIYTIDLHGNSKKQETSPDGSPDQNVFDIMQGVSINLFVKTGKKAEGELGKIFHFDLYGKREAKYEFLLKNSLKTVPYSELPNISPNYFFVSKNFGVQDKYNNSIKLTDLFTLNNVGIVTARDEFTIHDTQQKLTRTIEEFLKLDDEEARKRFNLGKDVRDWQVGFAKKDLQIHYPNKGSIIKIDYRPFDSRYTFYTGKSKGFHCYPRNEVMQHYIQNVNYGIILEKIVMNKNTPYKDVFITNSIYDAHFIGSASYSFPLYLYPISSQQQTMGQPTTRTPNLNKEIVTQIEQGLGLTFTPEKEATEGTFAPIDLLDYIYAILHSPTYRETYKEFLKIDFPRVPYPTEAGKFWELVRLGGELRQIHLLESEVVENLITQYPVSGSNTVGKPEYEASSIDITFDKPEYNASKVWINDTQYFEGVPQVAWDFYIGGYQPAQKWLKDRKNRTLDFDDIFHYQKIIVALTETDRIMKEIDRVGVV